MSATEPVRALPAWQAGPATLPRPVEVHFGRDCWRDAGRASTARRILLVTSPGLARRGTAEMVRAGWGGSAEWVVCDRVNSHPELAALAALTEELRTARCDSIVALGGGSVIDTAKILAVLLAQPQLALADLWREGGADLDRGLPLNALPTTAGTGSEVTPFATVWDRATGRKLSVSSPALFPRRALVDPELTRGVPAEVAAASALDALSQALESIWSRRTNAGSMADALAGLQASLAVLPRFARAAEDAAVREQLARASLAAGLAISHTRTALAHSMSYPLTARYGLPHGFACSFTLPAVLEFNAAVDDGRLAHAAVVSGCGSVAGLRDRLVAVLNAFAMDDLLRAHAIDAARLEAVASEMIHPGRADNNLRLAGIDEVRGILAATGRYLPACRTSHA